MEPSSILLLAINIKYENELKHIGKKRNYPLSTENTRLYLIGLAAIVFVF